MGKYIFMTAVVALAMSGCAGGRSGNFEPITSDGEKCLSDCDTRKAQCLTLKGRAAPESGRNACEDEYEACLKPCREYDEKIKKSF